MPTRSATELLDYLATGERVKYLPFRGHQPRKDGAIGASLPEPVVAYTNPAIP
ncbi:hypothetical protein [Nocardia sp. NPDC047648]|uniref:hypothetical protein n=1 Tax=Nocardia sp. NPDC047648 TaxID=3155625 RepID=UPI0033F0FCF7